MSSCEKQPYISTLGGRITGPKTEAGRQHCAAAKTTHGWETREKRRVRAAKLRELKQLRELEVFLRAIKA